MPRILASWDKAILHVLDELQRESDSRSWFTCAEIKAYVRVAYRHLVAHRLNKLVSEGIIVRSWSISTEYTYTFNSSRVVTNLRHNIKMYINSTDAINCARIQHAYNKVALAHEAFFTTQNDSVATAYNNRLTERVKQGNF